MLLKILYLMPVILAAAFLAFRFWSTAIMAMLLWAMIEGTARKWIFPGLQAEILIFKDFMLLFAYLGYFLTGKRYSRGDTRSRILAMMLVVQAAYCFIELLNPNSPSFVVSLYGLKNYLIYLPLAFILPQIILDRERVRKLAIQVSIVAIPIGTLALYQFSQPPTSWVNQYVSHEEGAQTVVSLFGAQGEGDFKYGRARTSSTFSYIGGLTTWVLLVVPLAASMMMSSVLTRRRFYIVAAAFVLSLGASMTTGARTPIIVFMLITPIMLLIAWAKGLLPIQLIFRIAVGAVVTAGISFALFGGAISALQFRAENADSPLARIASPVIETANAFNASPAIGTGIGTNANAAGSLMGIGDGGIPWWLNGNYFELEPARIMQEIGLGGFIVVMLPKVFVIFLIFGFLLKSQSRLMIAIHMTALMFVIVHFILFTINNPTGGLIYWALVGLCIACDRIERAEQRQIEEAEYYRYLEAQSVAMALA